MPLNEHTLAAHLIDHGPLPPLDLVNGKQALDLHHRTMFLEELDARYPRDEPARSAVSLEFVTRAVATINRSSRITPAVISAGLDDTETALELVRTVRPARPVPAATREGRLVDWLDQRRGYYTWQGEAEQNEAGKKGIVSDFRTWLTQADPLANPLGADAKLICWEPVLLAAAHVGFLTVDQLRTAYSGNLGQGVSALLTAHGAHEIPRPPQSAFEVANQVAFGNVLLLSRGAYVDHAVVVATPSAADLSETVVQSLWNAGTGGVLGPTPLWALLHEVKKIRYAAL